MAGAASSKAKSAVEQRSFVCIVSVLPMEMAVMRERSHCLPPKPRRLLFQISLYEPGHLDMRDFSIRPAHRGDEGLIVKLLQELAEYEKLLDKFHITAEVVRRDYLSERPLISCDLAFEGAAPVGVATWYWVYSSFAARRAIYLEDLYVRPVFRGKGYGKTLLAQLAKTAVEAGAVCVDWSVLDWNKPSIDFYDSLGAKAVKGWYVYRLESDALKKLGGV